MGRFARELEADFARLYPQHSLTGLWQARRWRYLLLLIDHMPQDTYYHQAISLDPDHAKMIVEARKRSKSEGEKWAPPMHSWSGEVEAMTKILDAVRGLQHTLVAVNSEKGKSPKPPKPFPRPRTILEKMEYEDRRERHESLANRILARRKAKPSS